MVTSGSTLPAAGFFNFFSAPTPLVLPFPFLFIVLEGLTSAVLPISLNGLIGGAISHTCHEGIRFGWSWGSSTLVG